MLIQSFEMDTKRAAHKEGFLAGEASGLSKGIAQGRSEGFSDGVRQNKLDTATTLKRMGLSVEQIVQSTGLTAEEIVQL